MMRGLTLIEMLLAVALLAILTVSAATWTRIAGEVMSAGDTQHHWRNAADAVLRAIHTDITCGDFETARSGPKRSDRKPQARIEVIDGALRIETRHGQLGACTSEYRLDSAKRLLSVTYVGPKGPSERALLDEVAGFSCELDEQKRLLLVTIEPSREHEGLPSRDVVARYWIP